MIPHIAIVDVSSYIFRAFHALPPMTSPGGTPVNSIYGFISMFLKTMGKFKDYSVVAALDSGHETFRKKKFPAYKANRKEVDPDLRVQFQFIQEMLDALNIPGMVKPGYEADDVIASIICSNPSSQIVIISSDKDLMQLISDGRVVLYDGMKDRFIDSAAVIEKFGVEPSKMCDLLSLTGDSSDNIPGLPGVGPKTAAALLNEYGTIDDIYRNLDRLKPSLKTKFTDLREQLEISRELVKLECYVDSYEGIDKCWNGVNTELFQAFALKLGFKSLLRKTNLVNYEVSTPEKVTAPANIEPVPAEDFTPWEEKPFVPGEMEEYFGLFSDGTFYLGTRGMYQPFNINDLPSDITVYSWEIKDFLPSPFPANIKFIDLQIAYFCHDSGRHDYSMESVSSLSKIGEREYRSAGEKFFFLSALRKRIMSMEDRSDLIDRIEMPHLEIIREMELNGIQVDRDRLLDIRNEFSSILAGLSEKISEFTGAEFNPNSPKQLGEVLFDKLGLPHGKKTKSGYSTDHRILDDLAELNIHPLPGLIIKHREYSKLISTYLDPIFAKTGPDGRLRTTFIVTHASTGRLASREPNLQNIPVKTSEGRKIRDIFIAPPGKKLISLDYSQIELRILASLSREPELISAFQNGEDIHTKTACAIFQTIPELVDASMRRHAKAVNFGIIYGMQAFKLSQDTGVDISFAKKYIETYFDFYPNVKMFIDSVIEHAKTYGWVETLMKRRRYIPEISSSNKNVIRSGERMAVNTVIQGSAADIIKTGTIAVHKMLREKHPGTGILLQIHDELIIETPENADDIAKDCSQEMISAGKMIDVPLEVNFSTGARWSELK